MEERITRCPEYIGIREDAPACYGKWVRGSGGHRIHEFLTCQDYATWWDPDSIYSYCDKHVPERDKKEYLDWWNNPMNLLRYYGSKDE